MTIKLIFRFGNIAAQSAHTAHDWYIPTGIRIVSARMQKQEIVAPKALTFAISIRRAKTAVLVKTRMMAIVAIVLLNSQGRIASMMLMSVITAMFVAIKRSLV